MGDQTSYDPTHSELLEDTENAYQPHYVPSVPNEDSFSDELSEDEEFHHRNSLNTGYRRGATPSPSHDPQSPSDDEHGHELIRSNLNLDADDDQEYHVDPLLDVTTPAYAPSRTFGSPSESPLNSSDSDGRNSPHINENAPREDERHIQDSLKREKREETDSDSDVAGLRKRKRQEEAEAPGSQSPPHDAVLDGKEQNNAVTSDRALFDEYDDEGDENKGNEDFEGFERDEQPESQVDGIIADIFGESDAEEEFEGFAENELEKGAEEEPISEKTAESSPKKTAGDSDGDESGDDDAFVSDFDQIMARKREEMRRRRRRNRDIEFLNDSDDLIVAMISRMKQAADDDRQLVAENKPATKKLTMVSDVTSLLRRADLRSALVENGMLSAITEWLAPLPGHTLPNLVVRDAMLTSLSEFQSLSAEVLQESGVGKALMYLYKHPRETRENKDRAGRLINEWLRPIFNLTSDYRTLTKEERKQLDYEHLPKRRNIENETYDHRDINRELDGEAKGLLRPGDPGWIGRARVPQPSNKDYVVRPKWRVNADGSMVDDENGGGNGEGEDSEPVFRRRRKPAPSVSGLGTGSRLQAHIRNLTQSAKQRNARAVRAVPMSIEGRKMSL
ncbi:unnamed protein product [Calicophoron daubneyi]|uniref:TFIIS N-terminal domain-containing protein n=1 Tax=Calicophoron daubneyi TaxID=300641 RepID=A0AAV2T8C1_CALDB